MLHDCGIIHRDVRAENVFISSRDPLTVKIGDLGLSHVLANASSSSSVSSIVDGPVAWMSPETLSCNDEAVGGGGTAASVQIVSKRGDVYMLGGLMHEVLTGTDLAGYVALLVGVVLLSSCVVPVGGRVLEREALSTTVVMAWRCDVSATAIWWSIRVLLGARHLAV